MDWIGGVRKCLMRALIPEVEKAGATCAGLKEFAFESHPGCYVEHGFCDIVTSPCNWDGLYKVFELEDLFTEESWEQIKDTLAGCGGKVLDWMGEAVDDIKDFWDEIEWPWN